ncbi:MAG: hypothetical protein VX498_11950, partial [Myxococcota bacterium]|nr:hypothetical protein [Myxococcota bacterium]
MVHRPARILLAVLVLLLSSAAGPASPPENPAKTLESEEARGLSSVEERSEPDRPRLLLVGGTVMTATGEVHQDGSVAIEG